MPAGAPPSLIIGCQAALKAPNQQAACRSGRLPDSRGWRSLAIGSGVFQAFYFLGLAPDNSCRRKGLQNPLSFTTETFARPSPTTRIVT